MKINKHTALPLPSLSVYLGREGGEGSGVRIMYAQLIEVISEINNIG